MRKFFCSLMILFEFLTTAIYAESDLSKKPERFRVLLFAAQNDDENSLLCSGALLSLTKAVAPASCFFNSTNQLIDLDEIDTIIGVVDFINFTNTFTSKLERIHIHPEFVVPSSPQTALGYLNNVAVVVLNTKVPVDHPGVEPIGMISYSMPLKSECTLVGTQIDQDGVLNFDVVTKTLSIQEIKLCFPSTNTSPHNGLICVMDTSFWTSKPNADGTDLSLGSALICRDVLAGLRTIQITGNAKTAMSIYTDVDFYWSWITENAAPCSHRISWIIFIFSWFVAGFFS